MRLFELATQIGIEKNDLNQFLEAAREAGFEIKNSLAVVGDDVENWATQNRAAIAKKVAEQSAAVAAQTKAANEKRIAIVKKPKKNAPRPVADKEAKTPPKAAPVKPTAKIVPPKKSPVPPRPKSMPVTPPRSVYIPPKLGTVTITQDEAKTNEINAAGFKHKRADFKTLVRPELPALFSANEGEYTRSLRASAAPARRAQPQQQQQRHRQQNRRKSRRRNQRSAPIARDENFMAQLQSVMSIRELSEALGVKLNEIIGYLMREGEMVTANDILDESTIETIAENFKIPYEWAAEVSLEDEFAERFEQDELDSAEAARQQRPPIVTFMGHVDHGKTSLLDKIRSARVVDSEHGGITQHIGAYTVERNGQRITFLDTPGHEAFTQMRARGANLTDVVVLVVAADDGVMPQTKEAAAHAKSAGVPIVVAVNKCDVPNANPEKVKQEVATQLELLPEDWGGKVGIVQVSAKTGEGIDTLLERILLEAEMLELDADPSRPAVGYVVESKMTDNRGAVATVLISDGTLHRGDALITGNGHGKVRLMYDWSGALCETGEPGDAVSVVGLNNVPEVGDKVYVVGDLIKARKLSEEREARARAQVLASTRRQHVSLENLMEHLSREGQRRDLNVIIKADVSGSLEVLQKTFADLATSEVGIKVIHSGVGGISQADVILADASDALVIGFHVVADSIAKFQAMTLNVQLKIYHVIYRLIEDMKAAMEGLLPKVARDVVAGHAEVREVFRASKIGTIAGCYVTDGSINRKCRLRLIRDQVVIYDNVLESLKRFKDDAREVRAGFECGIKMSGYDDLRQGDIIEAYEVEEVARKLG
ncbi:hypothetical protein AGMMS49959_06370 [Planctomycetales bacterium]|nr:hypothetical protein AGMMS49959_06370 [Planctomycetales bacterium]